MDKRYIVFLKEYLLEEYELRNQDRKLVVKNVEKEIQEVDKNINNVLDSFTTTQSEIVRRKLEQKIEELEHRKQMLQNQNILGTKERDFNKILDYACMVFENPYELWK